MIKEKLSTVDRVQHYNHSCVFCRCSQLGFQTELFVSSGEWHCSHMWLCTPSTPTTLSTYILQTTVELSTADYYSQDKVNSSHTNYEKSFQSTILLIFLTKFVINLLEWFGWLVFCG